MFCGNLLLVDNCCLLCICWWLLLGVAVIMVWYLVGVVANCLLLWVVGWQLFVLLPIVYDYDYD